MAQANVPFDKRMKRIVRRHDRMAGGAVKSLNSDGLIVERPRVYRPKFPLKIFLVVVGVGLLFKAVMLAHLGAVAYDERVAVLQEGTTVEKVGAWVMKADPATVYVAEFVSKFTTE